MAVHKTLFPTIPGYRIKKKLGQGGMANVYLGVQENLSRMVAVKVLSPSFFDNKRLSKRFLKEARTLSKLAHPNIVTIFDVGQTKDCYYIVMEYLQDSLKDRIEKSRGMDPVETLHIINQVADAIFYAHDNGIIHRDIKPDNILFRKDGTPVVLDFGIAKALHSNTKLTKTGMSIGTPQYMSPEQCNAAKVDGRSDIYSLGVVLYEMLMGKPPYMAKDTMGIVMKHLRDPVPELPLPLRAYQPLIDKMMAKELKKRIRTKNGLDTLIKKLLNLNTTTTSKTTAPNKKTPQKRKKPAVTMTKETVHHGSPTPVSEVSEEKGKSRALRLFWVLVVLSLLLFVFQAVRGEPLTEFFTAAGSLFTAIWNFIF